MTLLYFKRLFKKQEGEEKRENSILFSSIATGRIKQVGMFLPIFLLFAQEIKELVGWTANEHYFFQQQSWACQLIMRKNSLGVCSHSQGQGTAPHLFTGHQQLLAKPCCCSWCSCKWSGYSSNTAKIKYKDVCILNSNLCMNHVKQKMESVIL